MKRTASNNIILVEGEVEYAIKVEGQAQGLDILGNVLVTDKELVGLLKRLIVREQTAFSRGYRAGLAELGRWIRGERAVPPWEDEYE